MSDPAPSPPAGREFVFRTIQRLMFVDIVGGIALALLGLFVLDFPAMTIGGIFLAGMGVGLVLLFGRMARRAAGRSGPHELRR